MNRKLLDPFEPEYPEAIEACLDDEFASACQFSHHGGFLATAGTDGRCLVWDMDTLNVIRTIQHGLRALNGVSWSRNGQYLFTYDCQGLCKWWDLKTGQTIAQMEFESSITMAQMHPRDHRRVLVCLLRQAPCLVDITDGVRTTQIELDLNTKQTAATCGCFGKKGRDLFLGTSRGYLHQIDTETLKSLSSVKLSGSSVTTISCNRRGADLVTNSSDRILRVCQTTPALTITQKIMDSVNRVNWTQAVFSGSGDYVVSGIEHRAEHNIYVWDKHTGSLIKMLTGPNELLEDLAVHPLRAIYATVSTFGIIYLWTRIPQQNWNAFAPGFRELEENVEYAEREDEFDKELTESSMSVVSMEDAEVDVTGVDPLFSDSESDEGSFVLEVVVEPEELPLIELMGGGAESSFNRVISEDDLSAK